MHNQTLSNTSDSVSHSIALSGGGGSLKLIEGNGILLNTSGTTSNGAVTISAVNNVDTLFISNNDVYSGEFLPNVFDDLNISEITAHEARFTFVEGVVNVSGHISFEANGNNSAFISMFVPVNAEFTNTNQLSGTFVSISSNQSVHAGIIQGIPSNGVSIVFKNVVSGESYFGTYTYQYKIN